MRNALSKLGTIVAAALLGVAALVSPVHATYYDAIDGTTLGDALGAAQAGDTIYISAAGNYGAIAPATGTEVNPIVIIGNTSNPRTVVITSYIPSSHSRLYGAKINGLTFGDVKHAMISDCYISAVIDMKDADSSSIRRCTVVSDRFRIARNVTGGTVADADTLEGNTFTALSASGQMALEFGDTAGGAGDAGSDSCRYFVQRFNTFAISQSGTSPNTVAKHFLTPNFYSYGNKYTVTSTTTGAGDEGNYTVLFRDHSRSGIMRRDTILVNNEGGTQSQYGLMWTSGMAGNSASNFGWQVDSCYIRVYRGATLYLQTQVPGLRFRYNVLRSRLSTAIEFGNGFEAASNDPYFHHNTVMGKSAVYFSEYANSNAQEAFTNNILWGTNTASCDAYSAVAGTTGNLTSISDSNFVYSTTADSARAFCKTACASPRTGAWSTTYSNDLHSYWGNPSFADTSWASLDVTPATDFTESANFTLGHVGAAVRAAIAQDAAPAQHGYPRVGLYAGAGASPRQAWWPLVESGRDGLRATEIANAARFDVISLNPAFADSAGPYGSYVALTAIKALREANPNILVLGEPLQTAAYERTDADTANKYNYYFQAWRAADQIDKGNSVYATVTGAWTPKQYTDSLSSPGFLWSNRFGYRGWFYQTAGTGMSAGTAGVPGYSNWNINLAYQPSTGVFPLCDSVAAVVDRHFIRRKHPDGTYVFDGVQFDLATSGAAFVSGDSAAQTSDAINWKRAGYSSKAAFDTAWVAAHNYLAAAVRAKAIAAGRQYFLLGGNGGSGVAYASYNGWMREGWPGQQGAYWLTNLSWNASGATRSLSLGRGGGADADANRFQYDPQLDWIFSFACSPYDSCSSFSPYDADNLRRVRYGLGTACLTGATFAWGPSFASLAKGGGYEGWWYDEYAVDTVTAQASLTANPNWLGEPAGTWYNNAPPINGVEQLGGNGTFEASNGWTFATSGGGATATITYNDSAAYSGSKGLRVRVTSGGDAGWRVAATISDTFAVSTGDTVTLTFRARSDVPRMIEPRIGYGSGAGTDLTGWSSTLSLGRYVGTEWRQYRFSAPVSGAQASALLSFWFGDTTGVVDLDDVTVYRSKAGGRARGGSYIREFAHGIVIVNPTGIQDTVIATRKYKRIKTRLDVGSAVNTGAQIAVGDPIVIATNGTAQQGDAVFLINSRYIAPVATTRKRGWLSIWLNILGRN